MNKKTEKNNQAKTGSSDHDIIVKKRGRPKGSKNTVKRIDRQDLTAPGENAKMLRYSVTLSELPQIDYENVDQVKQRIKDYYDITIQFDTKPAVACLALAFGFDRHTLFNVLNGKSSRIKAPESIRTIKAAYDIITSQYEQLMNNGKINPVSGIFLMKNNFGYRDQTEYTITANQEKEENTQDIVSRAGLLIDE